MGVPGRELPVRPPCLPMPPEGRTVAVFSPRAAARALCVGAATRHNYSGHRRRCEGRHAPHKAPCGGRKGVHDPVQPMTTASCRTGRSRRGWPGVPWSIAASTTTRAAISCGHQCRRRTRAPRLSCASGPRPGRRIGTRRYRPSGGDKGRRTTPQSPRSPEGAIAVPMSGARAGWLAKRLANGLFCRGGSSGSKV